MRRIEIAVLLSAKVKYDEIIEILRVGRDKISSVHKCLLRDDSGYKIIIGRLIIDRKRRLKKIKKEEKDGLSSFSTLKNKYKGHFLLMNLLDAAIDKIRNDKDLEKEALLFTPSSMLLEKINK